MQNRGPQDPLIGKVIADRFEMLDRIGEGGMGVVYRARQISVDRMVAIKVLNAQVAQDPQWVQRFINEAKACSKLQHPNTVRLIDFGQTREGLLFMAMEFLDGQSLRAAIDRGGRMQAARVLKIIIQCCQSLAEAHGLGIIHRDIKPDNLYLVSLAGQTDFLKVLDFSVAKLKQQAGSAMQTQAGVVFGTPNYMSPEQGRGLPLDARSDIYALGIVAYEMCMGKAPFTSQNPMEVLAMHVKSPVPPMQGVPDRVAQVIMRSLAKDAAHRQQTVEQLQNECQAVLAEVSGGTPQIVGVGMSASGPIPQQAPMMQAPASAKTLFADAASIPRPPALQQQMANMGGPPPAQPAAAKTMIAGMDGAPPPMMPQNQMGNMGAGPPPPVMPPPQQPRPSAQMPSSVPNHTPAQVAGNPKTVMLQPSEGVVSFAQQGKAVPSPGQANGRAVAEPPESEGSSALFWIVCIAFGVGIGVVAYLIVSRVVG
jgi:serine/threonine-protein kinase